MGESADTFFGLHFKEKYEDATKHNVPALNLVQALEGLQRTVHLVAMMQEGREVRSRARVTRDIEERFQLLCEPSSAGSFYQSTFIAERDQSLFSPDEAREVAEVTRKLLSAIASGDERAFKNAVPDSAFRGPIISSVGKMFSGNSGRYRLDVEDKSGQVLVSGEDVFSTVESWRQSKSSKDTLSILTGYVSKVDFKERKLTLHIPSTGRLITCIYEEQIEGVLLENARDLVQVVGTIDLDDDGNPKRITDVQEVHAVNIDDIDVIELLPANLKPNALNNLRVKVELTEDKQTYLAALPELGIEVAAYTRSDLVSSLEAEIGFLWKNIAKEDDSLLAAKAKELKDKLNTLFVEI